jgi:CPA2 family monovalent cation:H+ antiporter-2
VGQTVTRLLRENDIEPTIIELNRDTVRCLREVGVSAVYGDASHREILQGAGMSSAGSLILSAAGLQAGPEVIRLARELNPAIHILARTAYVRESPALRQAGAEYVFSGEGEVALAMTEAILRSLGATPEQIDRERARVHRDLIGGGPIAARQDIPLGQRRHARAESIQEGGGEQ